MTNQTENQLDFNTSVPPAADSVNMPSMSIPPVKMSKKTKIIIASAIVAGIVLISITTNIVFLINRKIENIKEASIQAGQTATMSIMLNQLQTTGQLIFNVPTEEGMRALILVPKQ